MSKITFEGLVGLGLYDLLDRSDYETAGTRRKEVITDLVTAFALMGNVKDELERGGKDINKTQAKSYMLEAQNVATLLAGTAQSGAQEASQLQKVTLERDEALGELKTTRDENDKLRAKNDELQGQLLTASQTEKRISTENATLKQKAEKAEAEVSTLREQLAAAQKQAQEAKVAAQQTTAAVSKAAVVAKEAETQTQDVVAVTTTPSSASAAAAASTSASASSSSSPSAAAGPATSALKTPETKEKVETKPAEEVITSAKLITTDLTSKNVIPVPAGKFGQIWLGRYIEVFTPTDDNITAQHGVESQVKVLASKQPKPYDKQRALQFFALIVVWGTYSAYEKAAKDIGGDMTAILLTLTSEHFKTAIEQMTAQQYLVFDATTLHLKFVAETLNAPMGQGKAPKITARFNDLAKTSDGNQFLQYLAMLPLIKETEAQYNIGITSKKPEEMEAFAFGSVYKHTGAPKIDSMNTLQEMSRKSFPLSPQLVASDLSATTTFISSDVDEASAPIGADASASVALAGAADINAGLSNGNKWVPDKFLNLFG